MKKTIALIKKGNNGKELMWTADIDGAQVVYTWGQIGGKLQEEVRDFLEGKNIGRANETSSEQQCLFEAEVKARKKIESGYSLIKGKLDTVSKTVNASDTSIPNPMLAKTLMPSKPGGSNQIKNVQAWRFLIAQRKLDGNRCLINLKTGNLYSRSRKQIGSIPGLGEIVKKACNNLKNVEWVDGELYSHKLTFNDIQSIVRKNPNSKRAQKKQDDGLINPNSIGFCMFDYISNETNEVRADKIMSLCFKEINERFDVVPFIPIKYSEVDKYHDKFVAEGYEGIIFRNPDGKYETKRSGNLIKHKTFIDEEFEVVGWSAQKNDSSLMGAAIVLDTETGKNFNATPAMSDYEKAQIWTDKESYIGKKATIKYQKRDDVTGLPIFGILKGFRDSSDIS